MSRINLPSIENPPEPKHIEAGLRFLSDTHKSLKKNEIPNFNGMFAVIDNNADVQSEIRGACHASLKRLGFNGSRRLVATLSHPVVYCNQYSYDSQAPQILLTEEDVGPMIERWFDYVVNQSFVAPYVLNKDKSARTLGVLFSADAPANVLAGGCMLTRHPREKLLFVAAWDYLVQVKNIHPDLAYMISLNCSQQNQITNKHQLRQPFRLNEQMLPYGSHTAFHYMSFKTLKNFFNRNYQHLVGSYRARASYYGVSIMFGTVSAYPQSGTWQAELMKAYEDRGKVKEEASSPIVNPFTVANTSERVKYMTWDTFLNQGGLELMQEMLK